MLPGLDAGASYHLDDVTPAGATHAAHLGGTWLDGDGVCVSGAALAQVGVQLPPLAPGSALVLHVATEPDSHVAQECR